MVKYVSLLMGQLLFMRNRWARSNIFIIDILNLCWQLTAGFYWHQAIDWFWIFVDILDLWLFRSLLTVNSWWLSSTKRSGVWGWVCECSFEIKTFFASWCFCICFARTLLFCLVLCGVYFGSLWHTMWHLHESFGVDWSLGIGGLSHVQRYHRRTHSRLW